MDITVETFVKPQAGESSEAMGQTRLSLDDKTYRELLKLEERLLDSESEELMIAAGSVDIDAPAKLGSLAEAKMRLFLDPSQDAAHFHLVAKRSTDGALVYTEPTMIRMVAV